MMSWGFTAPWMILCETSVIDGSSNNLSLISIIEELHSQSFPFLVPRLQCCALVSRDNADVAAAARLRLVVEPPGREVVDLGEAEVTFRPDILRVRQRYTLDLFTFLSEGRYTFRLDLDSGTGWNTLARARLDVKLLTDQDLLNAQASRLARK